MTNKWTRRIDAAIAEENARRAEWQKQKNTEKAREINRLDRIERDILLLALAIFLLLIAIVLIAGWLRWFALL